MNTLILKSQTKHKNTTGEIPVTSRGRALYTIDWFINGKPVLTNHDNPRMTLHNGLPCC